MFRSRILPSYTLVLYGALFFLIPVLIIQIIPSIALAAFGTYTALGTGVSGSGNNSSQVVTVGTTQSAGSIVFLATATDNEGTTDGCSGTLHSVSDSQGNTWTKILECTETDGSSDDGVTISLFYSRLASTLTGSSDTVTISFNTGRSDIYSVLFSIGVGAGNKVAVEQAGATANSLSHSLSSLTSREYFLIGLAGSEGEDAAKTPDTQYTERIDDITTTSGQLASNIAIHLQTRIATLTSDTVDSSAWTNTNPIQSLSAIYETAVSYNHTLSAYRFFGANNGSTDVGTPLASQDTAPTLTTTGQVFRLRVLIHESGDDLIPNGETFKLQFSARSGTCDSSFTGESYVDVTTSTAISYNDAIIVNDGDPLTANANDPTHSGHTIVNQSYEEANNFSVGTAIPSGQDGKWDFSLYDNGAPGSTTYCFRIVKSDNSTLNTYTVLPEITTAAGATLTFVVTHNNFPAFAPGTPVFATTTLSVNTTNSSGWNVIMYGDDQGTSNTVMDLTTDASIGITDEVEWVPGTATTTAGNAVGSFSNSGDVLAFRVMTASGSTQFRAPTWWGSADNYAARFDTFWAGIPSSTVARKIGDSSVSSGGSAALNTVLYYLDVPGTQQTGTYTGGLTFSATTNP